MCHSAVDSFRYWAWITRNIKGETAKPMRQKERSHNIFGPCQQFPSIDGFWLSRSCDNRSFWNNIWDFFLDHSRLAHKRWTPSLVQKFRLVMDLYIYIYTFFFQWDSCHSCLPNKYPPLVCEYDPFKHKFSFSSLTIIITRLKELLFVFKRMYDLCIIYAHKSLLTHKDNIIFNLKT